MIVSREEISTQRATQALASVNRQYNDDVVLALCSMYWMLRNRWEQGYALSNDELAALNYVDRAIGGS